MMAEYIDKLELLSLLEKKIKADNERRTAVVDRDFIDLVNDATVISDIVEVDIIEKIIRKKADVSNYWQNYIFCWLILSKNSNNIISTFTHRSKIITNHFCISKINSRNRT